MSHSALRAAHLGTMASAPAELPSIFDIVSQESLMTSLKPAVGHLLKFLALTKPQKFATANRYYDELYLLFDLVLQNQYLAKYGGTFSENFYSIKRMTRASKLPPTELRQRIRNLLTTVIWPYIRDKLEKLYQRLKENIHSYQANNVQSMCIRWFVSIYPWLKRVFAFLQPILTILYMTNRTDFHSILLLLAGVTLEKLTPEDLEAFESIPLHLQGTGLLNRLYRFILGLPGVFSRLFGYGLFFVQFIDTLYNTGSSSKYSVMNNSQAPPPPHDDLLNESSVQDLETNKCPLCRKIRENSTALSVSGYAFCYACIYDYVRKYQRCPITHNHANTDNLIRLYIQE